MSERLAPGTQVEWASGGWANKAKKGTVIAFVPAHDHPKNYWDPEKAGAKKTHIKFDYRPSLNDRYIVAVPTGKDGKIIHYYAPLARWLEGRF